jgi:4-hydroxy-tetrahydrodipicolinate reductase
MLQQLHQQRLHGPVPSTSAATGRLSRGAARSRLIVMAASKPQIMVNSATGKMGQAVGEAALRAGAELVPFSLCGPGEETKSVSIGGHPITLVNPATRDSKIAEIRAQYPRLMMVDYTLPDAIHSQASNP